LQQYLIVPEALPTEKAAVLYILGASTRNTYHHIMKASSLYYQKKFDRILIINSNEKLRYEPSLHRNLKRNEWVIKTFAYRNVPDTIIEFMPYKEGIFGTLSESRAAAHYLKNRNYKSVILLTSPCHTRRVYESFRASLEEVGIHLYITGSEDPFSFTEMLIEVVKIQVYRFLIKSKYNHNVIESQLMRMTHLEKYSMEFR
jgi:hypothetical protein